MLITLSNILFLYIYVFIYIYIVCECVCIESLYILRISLYVEGRKFTILNINIAI
jgi:hypothetical protein